jgi:hypothetical protein
MTSRRRILVVIGRAVDLKNLISNLRERTRRGPARFILLVPAVPRGLAWAADMKAGWTDAIIRAEATAGLIREAGIELDDVVVGDPDPFAAAGDVLHGGLFDEVVISTLPHGLTRRLHLSLPERLRRSFAVEVSELTPQFAAESTRFRRITRHDRAEVDRRLLTTR